MQYFARGYEFGVAVLAYWYWWLTAVPFFLDQLLSRNFWSKAKSDRIAAWWPEETRHKFFRWLAASGFVLSCCLAFDSVAQELKIANAKLSTAQTDLATKSTELTGAQQQITELARQLVEAQKWRMPPVASSGAPNPRPSNVFRNLRLGNANIGIKIEGSENKDNLFEGLDIEARNPIDIKERSKDETTKKAK